jgi:predicted ATPase/tRNA A-37 threonylcarbamoyl transferase component Bud32
MEGTGGPVRADEVFLSALERPRAEWSAFVRLACGGDAALCRSVFSLLRAHEHAGPLDRLGERLPAAWAEVSGHGMSGGAASAPRLASGATLGRYEIRDRLGAGGMGEVYRAFDQRLHREVAIKVIAHRIEDQAGALGRFEEEARAASALNHPNIVTVYDIGEQQAFPYIVMELVEGDSLRSLMDTPLPVERVVRLGSQLAGALAAAHERGVVHRDLKPENVVVTPGGVAKILDFGLAQFQPVEADPNSLPTLTRALVGTVGYMAPEALTGRAADHRSDQFALGAMLYEMATGRACFRRSSVAETLAATLREEPGPLAERRPELPRPLVQLVERCLAKDPADRYPSTWQVHKALSTLAVGPVARSPRRGAALPAPPHAVIGRRDELNQIQNLMLEARVRLVTVSGPGGCGKTRLAIEAARELEPSFPGGVVFVSLAALTDPELVSPTIAQATGGVEAPSGRDLPALFVELVAQSGPILLVLDNFEQVVAAAPVVGEMLARCPELSVLVTSREVLRLQAEHDFPLAPLALPPVDETLPVDELERTPAVALFVERARAADPAFALRAENAAAVVELCARLDGLPLALELAAVRVRTLAPQALLERLGSRLKLLTGGARDLPERQRTLRHTLDWSYGLLDAAEQHVFQRLGVFVGSFTLEAAEAVADPFGRLDRDVAEIVESLLDKSLLVRSPETEGESRFFLLETVREYALERLSKSEDEGTARKAHAAYFRVLAEEAEVAWQTGARGMWLDRFAKERHNLRAALGWVVAQDLGAWGLAIVRGLHLFWLKGQDIDEGRRRLDEILALPSARAPTAARASGLEVAGALCMAQQEYESAVAFYRGALELHRRLGNRVGQAGMLNNMGVILTKFGRHEEATACLEECLPIWGELGDSGAYARTILNYADLLRDEGELERARQLYQQATAMFERTGDRVGAAWEASHEGDVALEQGDTVAAAALYERALLAFREVDDGIGVGSAMADLGNVARTEGALPRAEECYRQALQAFVTLEHRSAACHLLEALAVTAEGQGRPERALLLAAAASTEHQRLRLSSTPDELTDLLPAAIERARGQLGPEAAAAVWRRGTHLSFDQAVRAATGE